MADQDPLQEPSHPECARCAAHIDEVARLHQIVIELSVNPSTVDNLACPFAVEGVARCLHEASEFRAFLNAHDETRTNIDATRKLLDKIEEEKCGTRQP